LFEKDNLTTGVELNSLKHKRITLTLPTINNAKNIIFIVTGKNKCKILKKILDENDENLPASLIKSSKNQIFFLLDKNAASLVKEEIG